MTFDFPDIKTSCHWTEYDPDENTILLNYHTIGCSENLIPFLNHEVMHSTIRQIVSIEISKKYNGVWNDLNTARLLGELKCHWSLTDNEMCRKCKKSWRMEFCSLCRRGASK